MVSHYSKRAITFPTDRLPALAGIATDTAALLNDTYVSGIWKKALHNGILYRSLGCIPSLEEPPVAKPLWNTVPSWSWAFLNTPIYFATTRHPPDTLTLCTIEALPSDNSQPRILGITGTLMRMDWVKTSPENVELQAFWKPAWDDPIFERAGTEGRVWDICTQEDHWFAQHCYALGRPYFDALLDQVFFMPVLFEGSQNPTVFRSFSQISHCSRIIGLLLRKEVGKGRGVFQRVGTVEFRVRRRTDNALDMFTARMSRYQSSVREEDFRSTEGTGAYTIWVR